MKWPMIMCAMCVLGGACSLAVLAADALRGGASPDWPQVSAEAVRAFSEYQGGLGNVGRVVFLWPGADEKTYTTDQVPEKVREDAARWVAKVLKENYVEADISKKMIGVRRTSTPGKEIDQIFVRYRKGDVAVQVCEHAVGMTVLICPIASSSKGPEDWQAAMSYATQVFIRTFNQPTLPIKYVTVTSLWSEKKEKNRIFYGMLSLSPYSEMAGMNPQNPRYWFDQVTFLVDGDKVAFSFFKTDGEVWEGAARPPAPSGKRW